VGLFFSVMHHQVGYTRISLYLIKINISLYFFEDAKIILLTGLEKYMQKSINYFNVDKRVAVMSSSLYVEFY